jgi:CheY-like chemotaxis protein
MVTENARPAKVFAVVNDLFFEAKIGEVLRTLGVPVAFAKSEDGLAKRLAEARPVLAIVDMGARGIDGLAAIARLRAEDAPVIAFISHVRPEDAQAAKAAGATEAWAKSQLVHELPDVVMKYAGHLGCRPA